MTAAESIFPATVIAWTGSAYSGFQGGGEPRDAHADLSFHFAGRRLVDLQLTRERLECPVSGSPAPKLINASSVGACSGRATTLAKRILQDVLGKGRVAHSTFQVPQKRTVVLEQRGDLYG